MDQVERQRKEEKESKKVWLFGCKKCVWKWVKKIVDNVSEKNETKLFNLCSY